MQALTVDRVDFYFLFLKLCKQKLILFWGKFYYQLRLRCEQLSERAEYVILSEKATN